jgi:hypothetical protein
LGFIWGTVGYTEKGVFFIRNQNRSVVGMIKKALHLDVPIEALNGRTGIEFRCRIRARKDVGSMLDFLQDLEWTPLNAEVRHYPQFEELDHRAFIRGWCFLHSTMNTIKTSRPAGMRKPRLRIYGNAEMLETMKEVIARYCDAPIVTPQRTVRDKIKNLYYQGTAAVTVCEWLGMRAKCIHLDSTAGQRI